MNKTVSMIAVASLLISAVAQAADKPNAANKPNVIIYFADDISARDFLMYGSSVWSDLQGHDTTDPSLRATTPVLDRLAKEGAVVKTAWAATICSPSRDMMNLSRHV